ncbi:MAG TPA: hypothetical protein VD815_09225 [Candidatus Saccharimonadales bacterium]|nr:hypothetical protein [Candidatus Saccharimonadales bacterium]
MLQRVRYASILGSTVEIMREEQLKGFDINVSEATLVYPSYSLA